MDLSQEPLGQAATRNGGFPTTLFSIHATELLEIKRERKGSGELVLYSDTSMGNHSDFYIITF
jgi:hypothetical protein